MANNTLLASDNFASGSLASGWSAWPALTECQITASPPFYAEPTAIATSCGQLWTGLTWGNDQISEVTVHTLNATGTNSMNLAVRYQNPGGGNQGYEVVILNTTGTVTLLVYKVFAGTPTQLGSTVTGLTSASGDVWTFAAIGSCILVYQNGNRVFFIGDATVAGGGAPGFLLTATTAVVDAQVASWRGYSSTQQDGVWTKEGCVFAANSTELGESPSGNTGFLGLSFGAARFLSGQVYRGYYAYGANVGYAESPDGVNWTRYSSNPLSSLAGYVGIDPFLYNGTYYLWAQQTQGSSTATLFTSTDGLTWANGGNTNLPSGAGYYYGLHIADVIGGNFYGLFSKIGSGVAPVVYLATSPVADGLNWTVQNGGNPVISGTFCGFQIVKVGSTYYFWATQNQVGQGSGSPFFDPFEAVRWKSTNLTNWTQDSHSLHNALLSDSFNSITGGVAATAIINVGGLAYLYYQGSPADATSPQIYQTMLAIGPSSIAGVVSQPETATPQIASDAFTSGTGPLSANWTTPSFAGADACKIVAGPLAEGTTASALNEALYTGATFSANQYAEITVKTVANSNCNLYPIVRGSLAVKTQYLASVSLTGTRVVVNILRQVSGVSTILSPTPTIFTSQSGDVIRLAVVTGSAGQAILSLYQNGFLLITCEDWSPIASGIPGFAVVPDTTLANAQISLWAAGNANVIPNYGPVAVGWSPVDSRQAVPGFGPAANVGIVDAQGNVIYSAQNPPFTGNSQVSDNAAIPVVDSRVSMPADSRANVPVNSRKAPPF